jgi:hypothetical protein
MSTVTFPAAPISAGAAPERVSAFPSSSWLSAIDRERIWYEDPRGFLREDRLARFVPEPRTDLEAQLNAIMRFALYLSVFIALLRQSLAPVISIVGIAAGITFLVYKAESTEDGRRRERMDALDVERDPATRRVCTRPTLDNPYMNVLVSDFKRFPERPGACDITRESVKDRADDLSSHDLYVDSDDVYGRRANSSPFYTNAATTIPNDQEGFARWLYQPTPAGRGTCREGDGGACLSKVFSPYGI